MTHSILGLGRGRNAMNFAAHLSRLAVLLGTSCLLVLCSSCSRPYELQFFNNTGKELVIISEYTYGNPEVKRYRLPPGRSVIAGHHMLRIKSASGLWTYPTFFVGERDVDSRSGKPRVVKLQIEPDGKLYLLPPATEKILTSLPPQRQGFPVSP